MKKFWILLTENERIALMYFIRYALYLTAYSLGIKPVLYNRMRSVRVPLALARARSPSLVGFTIHENHDSRSLFSTLRCRSRTLGSAQVGGTGLVLLHSISRGASCIVTCMCQSLARDIYYELFDPESPISYRRAARLVGCKVHLILEMSKLVNDKK